MSFDDLIYLQLKRRSERVEVKDDLAKRIRNWNKLDSAIYDHFLKRFNEKIAAFGTDKMAREVLTLRQKLDNVRDECVAVRICCDLTVIQSTGKKITYF